MASITYDNDDEEIRVTEVNARKIQDGDAGVVSRGDASRPDAVKALTSDHVLASARGEVEGISALAQRKEADENETEKGIVVDDDRQEVRELDTAEQDAADAAAAANAVKDADAKAEQEELDQIARESAMGEERHADKHAETGDEPTQLELTGKRHVTESYIALTIEVYDRDPTSGEEQLIISRKLPEVDPLWTVNDLCYHINDTILHGDEDKVPEQGWGIFRPWDAEDDGVTSAEVLAKQMDIDFVAKYLQGPRKLKFYEIKTKSKLHYKRRRRPVKFHIFGNVRSILIDESWRVYRIIKEIGVVLGIRGPDEYSLKVEDDPNAPEKSWLRGAMTLPEQKIALDVMYVDGEEIQPPILYYKKKLFFKHTPNFDRTNQASMYLYYQQCLAMVLTGELYVIRSEAILLAALQLLIADRGYSPHLHKGENIITDWPSVMPAKLIPSKSKDLKRLEQDILAAMYRFKELDYERTIVKYVKLCRANRLFGWANWAVSRRIRSGRKFRFVPRILSISGKGIRTLDPKAHNDVVTSHTWNEVMAVGGITINRGYGLMFDFSDDSNARVEVQVEDEVALNEVSQYIADYMRMLVLLQRKQTKRAAKQRDDVWGPLAVGFTMPPPHERTPRSKAPVEAKDMVQDMQMAALADEPSPGSGGAIVPFIPKETDKNYDIKEHLILEDELDDVTEDVVEVADASEGIHTTIIMNSESPDDDKSWDTIAFDDDDDDDIDASDKRLLAQADAQDNMAVLSASLAVSTNELLHASALEDPMMIDPGALLAAAQGLADMLNNLTSATDQAADVADSPDDAAAISSAHEDVQLSTAALMSAAKEVAAQAAHHQDLCQGIDDVKDADQRENLMALYEIDSDEDEDNDDDDGDGSSSSSSSSSSADASAAKASSSNKAQAKAKAKAKAKAEKLKAATTIDVSALMSAASSMGASVSKLLSSSGIPSSTERQVERLNRLAAIAADAAAVMANACLAFYPEELPMTDASILERRLTSLGPFTKQYQAMVAASSPNIKVYDVHNSLMVKGAQLLEMMRIATSAIPVAYTSRYEKGLKAYEAVAALYEAIEHVNDRPELHDKYANVLADLRFNLNQLKLREIMKDRDRLEMLTHHTGGQATELGNILDTETEALDVNGSWSPLQANAAALAAVMLDLITASQLVAENPDAANMTALRSLVNDALDALDAIHVERAHLFIVEDVLDAAELVLEHMNTVLAMGAKHPVLETEDGARLIFEGDRAVERLYTTMRIYSINPANLVHQDAAMQAARKAVRKFTALLAGIIEPLNNARQEGLKLTRVDLALLRTAELGVASVAKLKEMLAVAAIDCWPLDVNAAIQTILTGIKAVNHALDKVADLNDSLSPEPGAPSEFEWQASLLRSVASIPKEVRDIKDTAMSAAPAEFALDCKDVAAEVTILTEASVGMASSCTSPEAQYRLLIATRAFCTDSISLIEEAESVVREGNDPKESEQDLARSEALVLSSLDELAMSIPGIGDTQRLLRKLDSAAVTVSNEIKRASEPKVAEFIDLAAAATDLAAALSALSLDAGPTDGSRRGSIMADSALASLAGPAVSHSDVQKADDSPLAIMEQEVSSAGRSLAALVSSLDRAAVASPSTLAVQVAKVDRVASIVYKAASDSVKTEELAESGQAIHSPLLALLRSTVTALRQASVIAEDPEDNDARARFRQNDVAGSIATLHMTFKELAAPKTEAIAHDVHAAIEMITKALTALGAYKASAAHNNDDDDDDDNATTTDAEPVREDTDKVIELQERILGSTSELKDAAVALTNVAEVKPKDLGDLASQVGVLATKSINCVTAVATYMHGVAAAKAADHAAEHTPEPASKFVEDDIALVLHTLVSLTEADPKQPSQFLKATEHVTGATRDLLSHNKRIIRKLPITDRARRRSLRAHGTSLKSHERSVRRAAKVLRLTPDANAPAAAMQEATLAFSTALTAYRAKVESIQIAAVDHAAVVVENVRDALIDEMLKVGNLASALLATSELVVANPTHAASHNNMASTLTELLAELESLHETVQLISPGQKECVFAITHAEKASGHMEKFVTDFARGALPVATTRPYADCLTGLLTQLDLLEDVSRSIATAATASPVGLGEAVLLFVERLRPLRVFAMDAAATCGKDELGLRILRETRDIPVEAIPFIKVCQAHRGRPLADGATGVTLQGSQEPVSVTAALTAFITEIEELRAVLVSDRDERHSIENLRQAVETSTASVKELAVSLAAHDDDDDDDDAPVMLTYAAYVNRLKASLAEFVVGIKAMVALAHDYASRDGDLADDDLAAFGVHAEALTRSYPALLTATSNCMRVISEPELRGRIAESVSDLGARVMAFMDSILAVEARSAEASAILDASGAVSVALGALLQAASSGQTPQRAFDAMLGSISMSSNQIKTMSFILNTVDEGEEFESDDEEGGLLSDGSAYSESSSVVMGPDSDDEPVHSVTFPEYATRVAALVTKLSNTVTKTRGNWEDMPVPIEEALATAKSVRATHKALVTVLRLAMRLLTSVVERERFTDTVMAFSAALVKATRMLLKTPSKSALALGRLTAAQDEVIAVSQQVGHTETRAREGLIECRNKIEARATEARGLTQPQASASAPVASDDDDDTLVVYLGNVVDALKYGRHSVQKLLFDTDALLAKPLKLLDEAQELVRNYSRTVRTYQAAMYWVKAAEHRASIAVALGDVGDALISVLDSMFLTEQARSDSVAQHASKATLAMREITTTRYGPIPLDADEEQKMAQAQQAQADDAAAAGGEASVFTKELNAALAEIENSKFELAHFHSKSGADGDVDVSRDTFESIALRCCAEITDTSVTLIRVSVIGLEEQNPSSEVREELLVAVNGVAAAISQMVVAMGLIVADEAPVASLERAAKLVSTSILDIIQLVITSETSDSHATVSVRKAAKMVGTSCATLIDAVKVYVLPAKNFVTPASSKAPAAVTAAPAAPLTSASSSSDASSVSEMIRRKAEIERLQRDIETLKGQKVRRRKALQNA